MENVSSPAVRGDVAARLLQWSPIVLGAFVATAFSSVLLTFGATIGLGVTSTAPTWRDASAALAILSGLYLIIQAVLSFGLGGYIAGHSRLSAGPAAAEETEHVDGAHGLGAWALAVVMGALLAALIGAATINRTPSMRGPAQASTAEPLLSYELDRLFRAGRRAPNVDLSAERAEAGRILLTTSSHSGLSADDRTHLIQQVGALTGLSAPDAERRVDSVVASAKTAIARSRRSSIILAFSVATAILLGAVAAWAAACAGGRHRDGAPLPEWIERSNALSRRKTVMP
ncbi:hypothetical protein [Bradyrhizobium sp. sBnM-33]|uniref:hypothetical protein n=1 Tax=Bradyrhizobium sp. sBnM-33 TaxID=2831780 RepID=UPI001BCF72FF|nr:hypothetical protein [Bradyrhizobium sp. sBnM-33]WOH49679.1 hypothetical protein RX328_37395 [Bradyrhizobium sp. sBnM-33]